MGSGTLFTSSSENRLAGWLEIQRHKSKDWTPGHTITISREYGCEGYPLAEMLKEILDERTDREWTIFDKHLIENVSDKTGIKEEFFDHLGDDTRFMDHISGFMPHYTTHSEAFDFLVKSIMKIAHHGDAIIVGRGAAVIAEKFTNCSHFRLEAPEEFRAGSIASRLELDMTQAQKNVKENQKMREKFIEDELGCDIFDGKYYHAIFNNEKNEIEAMAESIYALCITHLKNHNSEDE